MEQSRRYYLHLAALLFLATGCASDPPPTEWFDTSVEAPSSQSAPGAAATDVATPREAAVSYANVDRYKEILARHIVLLNADHTFSGPLPPLLPAIVVLRISVDRSGRITNMFVQRSRDDEAAAVAMASLRRSGALPRPHNLLKANEQDLTFSETFLFNEDYRFQVRSLALPQPLVD